MSWEGNQERKREREKEKEREKERERKRKKERKKYQRPSLIYQDGQLAFEWSVAKKEEWAYQYAISM